ncbi:MAG: RluA family pseudouridine synthase [Nitrospiraceae bacterium]|nr:RluA family pseudouridine synthase [Nitrospiraceae bacterium]
MRFTSKIASTLLALLTEKTGTSSTKARSLIKQGAVHVDGKAVFRPDLRVRPGQGVEIIEKKSRKAVKPPLFPVLYEDEFLIAAQKPAGLLSISTKTENRSTFYRAVSDYVKGGMPRVRGKIPGAKIFIIHRLDREVSGVMLFAKNQEIKKAIQDSWDKTEKIYNALVEGRPPKDEDTITGWLCESGESLVWSCPAPAPDSKSFAKYAVTHYKFITGNRRYSLLEVRIETGRKHQIRVHMKDIGCPVVGDKKYGATGKSPIERMGLHAARLTFTHPVNGRKIVIVSPMPKSFMLPFKTAK